MILGIILILNSTKKEKPSPQKHDKVAYVWQFDAYFLKNLINLWVYRPNILYTNLAGQINYFLSLAKRWVWSSLNCWFSICWSFEPLQRAADHLSLCREKGALVVSSTQSSIVQNAIKFHRSEMIIFLKYQLILFKGVSTNIFWRVLWSTYLPKALALWQKVSWHWFYR